MENKEFIQALLKLAITALVKFIPFLASLSTMPVIGWLFGLGVTWLSGILAQAIATWIKYKQIDAAAQAEVDKAKQAAEALKNIQAKPEATKEEYAKAIEDFKSAYRDLIRIRVQQR